MNPRMISVPLILAVLLLPILAAAVEPSGTRRIPTEPALYGIQVKTIDGKQKTLGEYKGKALLIVNTASECGFTPQYATLEALHLKYKDRGFAVLGFPSNDFGGQEPGAEPDIQKFCQLKYATTFDLFSKVKVKGADANPLYKYLQSLPESRGDVTWNFNKYLVDPAGRVIARFDSKLEPMSTELTAKIEAVLPSKP